LKALPFILALISCLLCHAQVEKNYPYQYPISDEVKSAGFVIQLHKTRSNKTVEFNEGDKVWLYRSHKNGITKLRTHVIKTVASDSITFEPKNKKFSSITFFPDELTLIAFTTPQRKIFASLGNLVIVTAVTGIIVITLFIDLIVTRGNGFDPGYLGNFNPFISYRRKIHLSNESNWDLEIVQRP
jgi:hypothetical protein